MVTPRGMQDSMQDPSSWLGIDAGTPAVEAQSFNYWNAKEFPGILNPWHGPPDLGWLTLPILLASFHIPPPHPYPHFSDWTSGHLSSAQFSSVAQSCPTLCDPMNRSTPGFPVHHQLPEFTQTHIHRVGDAIQPSHPLSSPSPPALHLSQHQGLFKWVSSLNQVAKVLEFQLQHQSFQWTPRTDLL